LIVPGFALSQLRRVSGVTRTGLAPMALASSTYCFMLATKVGMSVDRPGLPG